VKLSPDDRGYPKRLCELELPPALELSRPLDTRARVVAIVGSREASEQACAFAYGLAYHLAKAGIVIASGGAVGVDTCAHTGAMAAGGSTWAVACTGRGRVYPPKNRALFDAIEASSAGRMIWPFEEGTRKDPDTPRFRNSVLVALSERVVVVQARVQSGSRNAASWAWKLGRALHVVPGTPWDDAFGGTVLEGARGAKTLWSCEQFFHELALPPPDMTDPNARWQGHPFPSAAPRRRPQMRYSFALPLTPQAPPPLLNETETRVFSAISQAPMHLDAIVEKAAVGTSATVTALLTLSLKNVVVEGPDGFFRRRVTS
jgi:DNA processing protein